MNEKETQRWTVAYLMEHLSKNVQPTRRKEDPGVTLDQVKGYLHLDDPEVSDITDQDLWLLVLDCWRSLKGTLQQQDVPARLLLQVVAIRYYQPRAHKGLRYTTLQEEEERQR